MKYAEDIQGGQKIGLINIKLANKPTSSSLLYYCYEVYYDYYVYNYYDYNHYCVYNTMMSTITIKSIVLGLRLSPLLL